MSNSIFLSRDREFRKYMNSLYGNWNNCLTGKSLQRMIDARSDMNFSSSFLAFPRLESHLKSRPLAHSSAA